MSEFQHTNRLVNETSPYLLQHKHNPVNWYPWGNEALAKAKAEDKPIFLSIGYSSCHWCHVMANESFECEKTAHLMNQNFINIKVRSTGRLLKAKIVISDRNAKVEILDSETGISPGQACVFYSKDDFGDKVLGGGWIHKTYNKNLST